MPLEKRKNKSGFLAVRLHYSVDPKLWPADRIAAIRAAIPGWRWLKEYEIDFGARGGQKVYDLFDPLVHVRPLAIDLAACPCYKSIDHGRRNPTACLWWAEDLTTRTVFFYREYYRADATIAEHCRAILDLEERDETRQTLIDPSTSRRFDNSSTTLADEYARFGVHTTPAQNNLASGIETVTSALLAGLARWSLERKSIHPLLADRAVTTDQLPDIAHERAVYFHPSMTHTIREVSQLSWDDSADTSANQPLCEQIASADDHCADCVRYALMRSWSRSTGVRSRMKKI